MSKKYFFTFFFVLLSFLAFSQNFPSRYCVAKENFSLLTIDSSYSGLNTTPWMFEIPSPIKIISIQSQIFEYNEALFDLCAKQLVYFNNDSACLPEMDEVSYFEIVLPDSQTRSTFKRIWVYESFQFTMLAVTGKANLYVWKSKNFIKGGKPRFQEEEIYFLSVNNGKLKRIRDTKTSLVAAFPDNKYLVKLFIRSYQINPKSLSDIKRTVEYYNRQK